MPGKTVRERTYMWPGCVSARKTAISDASTITPDKKRVDRSQKMRRLRHAAVGACPQDAIREASDEANRHPDQEDRRVFRKAVLDGRPHFRHQSHDRCRTFLRLSIRITICCFIPMSNVRILLDTSLRFSMSHVPTPSTLKAHHKTGKPATMNPITKDHDHRRGISPETNWMVCIDHAVKLGLK